VISNEQLNSFELYFFDFESSWPHHVAAS
jgi:hypothetical protein